MSMQTPLNQSKVKFSLENFKVEIGIGLFALFAMILVSSFMGCGDDITKNISSCPQGFQIKDSVCEKIVDEELVCGAVRTFQINYLDSNTKQPIVFPIASTMQNRVTLDDSNGRHRLNDPDGVYLYNNIVLCDEYQISASAVCYERIDRADFQIPLSTIYTLELQSKLHCNNNDIDEAFAECLVGDVGGIANDLSLCCAAFTDGQFDLVCGRLS